MAVWRPARGSGLPTGAEKGGDPVELMHGDPYDRARWLAARTGLDATAIWEWGVAERVSTGLWCTKLDMQSLARETLAVAERVAE